MTMSCEKELQGRRTARRSRFGCRNCKLRKLKCDEHKPRCKRCTVFGVLCNFLSNVPDLQPVADDAVRQPPATRAELQPPLTSGVWTSDASTRYQLNSKCQDFVTRYLGRSLINPDDSNMIQVNRKLLALAFIHPYLMHASLAVAMAYDRHLNQSSRSVEECYHLGQSIALFNRRIREPIGTKDKDPIWGTAAALAVVAFATPDATIPEESWPMISSASADLQWLRMSKGKMSLWCVANPMREDSIFNIMAPTYAQMHSPPPERGIEGMDTALASVCDLDESSTAETSPYFNAAHAISKIQSLPDGEITIGHTELFTRCIEGTFRTLLLKKDPVALLLLYLYYCRAGRSIWWIELRAKVECPAIRTYLRVYHSSATAVRAIISSTPVPPSLGEHSETLA